MDKKVGKRVEGVQKFPRCLRGLLLLLSFLIVFYSAIPVYAYSYPLSDTGKFTFTADNGEQIEVTGNPGSSQSGSPIIQGRLTNVSLSTQVYISGKKGDIVTFEVDFKQSFITKADMLLLAHENGVLGGNGIEWGGFLEPVDFSKDNYITTYELQSDVNNFPVSISVSAANFVLSGGSSVSNQRAEIGFNINTTVEDSTKGLLTSILDWIKQIPTKIGEFFTSLSNSLRSWFESVGQWFSNLFDSLKDWFESVGQWFTDLGDKISGFFDNLFNNIKDFFTNLFIPDENYFTDLSDDLDKTLSDSLGFIYTIPKTLLEEVNTMYNALNSSSYGNLTINMPAIEFNLLGKHYTLYEGGQTDLYQAGNMPWLDTVLDVARAMITIVIVVGCARMIYKKVVNKVGIEGGDEL